MEQRIKKAIQIFFIILFCVSLGANGWLTYQLSTALSAYHSGQNNTKILAFTSMFVEKVLMASADIDFDTRLTLETSVRALNDQQIFDQWQKFTKAVTKEDSSNDAKILLDLLIKKIKQ